MPKTKLTTRLDFTMSDKTAKHLAALQRSIRDYGHAQPTARTLVSALIQNEARRGKQLEDELLVPFRLENDDAE